MGTMKHFDSPDAYWDHKAKENAARAAAEAEGAAEYIALRYATDPIKAFNLFVKRNVDPSRHAHFSDDDDNEAEFVRRVIRQAQGQSDG
jgi:hypothetical protein